MNDHKDQFDAFMKLADFRMNVRKERRQLEWRVSLGLWVGLAAGMIALRISRFTFHRPFLWSL